MSATDTTAQSSAQPVADPAMKRNILLVFAGLMVTMLLASLDQTIFSTALPTIVGELNGVDHMLWVTTAYILASTIMLPVYGKLGDLIGRKGLFIAAIGLFIAGSVVGGLADNMAWLIAGRAIQGLGGGGLMILSQAIIADVVPARERGKYMGIMGGVFALSSVAGPLLGGWFTEGIGWRWAFWMNIPLGILAIVSAVVFLKLPKVDHAKPRIDFTGMGLLAIASTCLVLVTTWGGTTYDWDSLVIIGLIAGFVVAAIAFVMVERRAAEPIMPLHLFKDRNFNLTTIAGLITGIAMFGALAYLPTYLQMVTGVNATEAGLLMIPMMAALLVSSIVSGQLVSRTGRYKWLPIVGTVVVAGALVLMSTMTPALPIWILCSYLALMGLGLGMSMQILILIVQNSFPVREVGTATASNNYFRQIGAALGAAIVGSLFVARLTDLLAAHTTTRSPPCSSTWRRS
jgi:EmrB/QacA subfamily drug resistance transporter